VYRPFTPSHRGGAGSPLLCLHGFTDTWRTWELVLPGLERRHDVLAPTLPGHAGGPPPAGPPTVEGIVDAVACAMDGAGFESAHIVGNSLGGFVALRLAARGRATSVVALAPAGGWVPGDPMLGELLDHQRAMHELLQAAAPQADAIVRAAAGRRRATLLTTVNFEHIPAGLLAHQLIGVARCSALAPMVEAARREAWTLDAARITCEVRIVWGAEDALLPWPTAAARFRDEWLPHADWVVLDGVGHCPQLDVPLETTELILAVTARG